MTDTQRQAFLTVHLSPKSVRACTVRFDSSQSNCASVKEDAWKRKSASNENVCQVSKVIVSVAGIQLPVFDPGNQVCVNSITYS